MELLWLLILGGLAAVFLASCTSTTPVSVQGSPSPEASATEMIMPTQTPQPTDTATIIVVTDTHTPVPPTPTETEIPPSPTITSSPTPAYTSTPFPTATFTAITGTGPTRTNTPTLRWLQRRQTETPQPSVTMTASLTPTITLTPTPQGSFLMISRPGDFSKVVSPFRVEAQVVTGDDGLVRVEIIGEDSRVISQLWLEYRESIGRHFWITQHVEFGITAAAETGRLLLSVKDNFDRTIALSSVDLILLQLGENEIKPVTRVLEPYVIWYPAKNEVVNEGLLWVGGLIRPVNDTPLIIELIDEGGNILGQKHVPVPHPTGDFTHARFDVDVSYDVSERTPVRLTIRQESDGRIPGTIALNSRLIILDP